MENPNASQTTLDHMTAKVRAFPCKSCGAKLSFSPGSKTLKCPYCAAVNDIPDTDDTVEELSLDAWLAKLEGESETHQQEQIKCNNCGGEQTLAANLYASACTFCGTPLTSKSYAQRLIKPKSLVPFKVTKLQSQDKWRAWIKGLWLAPSALKNYAQSDGGIKGIYVPYWTFDAHTYTQYSGQRGVDHSESHDSTNSKGETVTETRTRTDWTNVSGNVSFFHDDVLVPGSTSSYDGAAVAGRGSASAAAMKSALVSNAGAVGSMIAAQFSTSLRTWNTRELVPYQDEYVTGFQAEAYQFGLKASFVTAKQIIEDKVQQLVRADIGGDHQRISTINTQFSHLTFKHILLPMWVSAYIYGGKTYRFVVNGQTGEVQGESPKSGWKVFFLVCAILFALFVLLAIFGGKR